MNVSREWAAQHAAKAAAPVREGWSDGALTVFVPGRPRNPLNGSHEHWSKRAKWAKGWRERAAAALYQVVLRVKPTGLRILDKKRITFTVWSRNPFDTDGMAAACKPVRDALKDLQVIDDDRPSSGHEFVYQRGLTAKEWRKAQGLPSKTKSSPAYGIALRIELASAPSAARPAPMTRTKAEDA